MKIWICGSHWTWKTTLVNSIDFNINKITNLARDLILRTGKPEQMSLGEKNVFQYTLYCEMFAKHRLADSFITDRTIFDVLAYTDMNSRHYWAMRSDIDKYSDMYDVVLYIPIEFWIESDWIRNEDLQFQKAIDEKIKTILRQLDVPYITITWTIQERVKKVEKIIKAFGEEN